MEPRITLPRELNRAVAARSDRFDREHIGSRMWAKDHTVWNPDPTEIADRLAWLWAPERYLEKASDVESFANHMAESTTHVVLLGMGGSSLAPEVMHAVRGPVNGRPRLLVVDSTAPDQIRQAEQAVVPGRTLYLVSSKSGSTIETLSQYSYFRDRSQAGDAFVAITDPGSALEGLAREHGFARTFLNDPDIGGRFSALSYFGLVPGAACGADIEAMLRSGREMAERCGPDASAGMNSAAELGIILGEAALAGRDKITLVLPERLSSFGWWVEQLIAESSGKDGVGILPVEGEPVGQANVYGDDRLFVAYGEHPGLAALEAAGHPVIQYPEFDAASLGTEFWKWEYATAIACWILGVNPFDQPNVQEAKDATALALTGNAAPNPTQSPAEVLDLVRPGDYIAINAFVARDRLHAETLQTVRTHLRNRHHVATVTGFGPRFLHSTGQLYKGGPNNGVFLQVVQEQEADLAIPGRDYTFGELIRAQADGDLASLQKRGRRVARLTMEQLAQLAKE